MKAMLVQFDVMLRVVVPDIASEDEVISKALSKATVEDLSYENCVSTEDDNECPFDPETD